MRERGLKLNEIFGDLVKRMSLSLRERGLKFDVSVYLIGYRRSLSLRERGLKSTDVKNKLSVSAVALLARAWIEIR